MAEARLRTGDTVGAWSDLQFMNSSADRFGDVPGFSQYSLRWRMFHTTRAGLELGAWTNDQMMGISSMMGEENALTSARRDMEVRKVEMEASSRISKKTKVESKSHSHIRNRQSTR